MECCFQGQGWIKPYNNDNPEVEPNPDYQPYEFLYNTTNKTWSKATNYCPYPETIMWSQDGSETSEEYYNIDEDILVASGNIEPTNWNTNLVSSIPRTNNYFCPPDLFRYCKSNVNIVKIFYSTGYTSQWGIQNDTISNITTYVNYGIQGRICPYLLKPIPGITSLEGFITNAKNLSYYILVARDSMGNILDDSVGFTYLIPKTFFTYAPQVSNLTNTFRGLNFPVDCKLDVFEPLKKSLTLDYTFYAPYFHTTSEKRMSIKGLFLNKSITSAKGTFSVGNLSSSVPTNATYMPTQHIDFGINFTKTKLPAETDTTNYKVQYVYDGYQKGYVTFDGVDIETGESKGEFKIHNTDLATAPYNYRTRT